MFKKICCLNLILVLVILLISCSEKNAVDADQDRIIMTPSEVNTYKIIHEKELISTSSNVTTNAEKPLTLKSESLETLASEPEFTVSDVIFIHSPDYKGEIEFPITLFANTSEELNLFIKKYSSDVRYFKKQNPEKMLKEFGFNENFFDDHFLICIVNQEKSSSVMYQSCNCIVNDGGELEVTVYTSCEGSVPIDYSQWNIFIAVDNSYKDMLSQNNIIFKTAVLSPEM